MVNDYDCPLLTLTANITIISSSIVIQSVSIVHECTSTGVFTTLPYICTVERAERERERERELNRHS